MSPERAEEAMRGFQDPAVITISVLILLAATMAFFVLCAAAGGALAAKVFSRR
jgi:hypothetical protein